MSLISEQENGYYLYWCEGCKKHHGVWTSPHSKVRWDFNGNMEKPTFSPSLLHRHTSYQKDDNGVPIQSTIKEMVCHVFITDGKIQYLNDCTHELAGQTIDMKHLQSEL